MVFSAMAGFFIVLVVGGVTFSAASADSSDEVAQTGAFGYNESTFDATKQSTVVAAADISVNEQSGLASSSTRDISSGLKMIDDKEREERERKEAENAAAIERMAAQKAKQGAASNVTTVTTAPAAQPAEESSAPASSSDDNSGNAEAVEEVHQEMVAPVEYNLPAVDWTVGKEEFLAEWTARIDAYLAGSPLAGYGATFAEAAWENGVDPRWSPAISNTESGKGSVCFRSHNAWGWGGSGWSDWDTAIRSHVAGLASGYGYSITMAAASAYCPPTAADWYNTTIKEMALI